MPKLTVPSKRRASRADDPASSLQDTAAPNPAVSRSRRSLRAGVGAFVAATLTAVAVAAPAQAAPLSAADQAFVDATVEQALRENGVGGMTIAISGSAGDYTRAYGYANGNTRTALTTSHYARIASVTKTFTGTAILQQIELGNLSFDDTVDEFITGIPNGGDMTIRHLLSMRAGLFNYQRDAALRLTVGLTPWASFEPEGIIRILQNSSNRPHFFPGTSTEYSESAFVVLGKILEIVTRRDAEDVINEDVIQPLRLASTFFPDADNSRPIYSLPTPHATGYAPSALIPGTIQDMTAFNPNFVWTDGAIVSTTDDLAAYTRMLGTGALLSSRMQAERLQFCPLPYSYEGPTQWGYGLGISSFGSWIGHSGSVAGFESTAYYEPTNDAVIAGIANFQSSSIKIWTQVMKRIAEELYPGSMDTPSYPTC